jgi:hypothetical protein
VTPMPEQRRPEPMVTPIQQPTVQTPEGFDIHRPSLDDLIKYKKGDGVRTNPQAGTQSAKAGGNPDPDDDDKFDPTKEEVKDFKKSDFKKGDNIGLHRFTQRIDGRTWKDPKSGQIIQKENAINSGSGPHGPVHWKLFKSIGEKLIRIGSITKDGRWWKP